MSTLWNLISPQNSPFNRKANISNLGVRKAIDIEIYGRLRLRHFERFQLQSHYQPYLAPSPNWIKPSSRLSWNRGESKKVCRMNRRSGYSALPIRIHQAFWMISLGCYLKKCVPSLTITCFHIRRLAWIWELMNATKLLAYNLITDEI